MGWREWLGLSSASANTRVEGTPPSGNGASSFHLFWQMPAHEPLREVSATFELLNEPAQDRLYFWALQAGFADADGAYGGAHFGFQWHPQYPAKRAVCWGGYANVGGELQGGRADVRENDFAGARGQHQATHAGAASHIHDAAGVPHGAREERGEAVAVRAEEHGVVLGRRKGRVDENESSGGGV